MHEAEMDRRRFLKAGALGLLGAGAAAGCKPGGGDGPPQDLDGARVRKYNVLGKTGIEVSDIGLGLASEESVLRYALDQGINLFDTGESYNEGQHERDIGRAFREVRDKVVVITKHQFKNLARLTKEKIIRRFDQSLERLGFDHVEIAMIHQMDDPATLECDAVLGAYEALKKAGKYRFLGFSTHQADTVCPPAFASNLFSVMLVIYNPVQYPNRSENIKKAKDLGIGVLVMKTMMGREQDKLAERTERSPAYARSAIKWALADEAVSSAMLSMRTFKQIDDYLKASGQQVTGEDLEILKKYVKAVDNRYCRIGCRLCQDACPRKVAINDIMRFGMYFDNYGEERRAMQEYARLGEDCRANPCSDCSALCEVACPHCLAIRDRLTRYDSLLRLA